jgi:polysaccharide export outer membrane protein
MSRKASRALVVAALLPACSGSGTYVWVHDLPPEYTTRPATPEYVIHDGDTVSIRVFNQESLSTRAKVRRDGRIAMPVLGDVAMDGKQPSAIKAELEARLKDYVNVPSVTVTVEEVQPIVVSVLGEVSRAGSYPLDPRSSVAQALASAGGLSQFASRDAIYVVRREPRAIRVRFTYRDICRGTPSTLGFVLHDGDLIVAE